MTIRIRRQLVVTLGALTALVGLAAAPTQAAAAPTSKAFHVTEGRPAGTGVHIRNINSDLCLAARAGWGERPVVQTTCDYHVGTYWPDQYWEYIPVAADPVHTYRIRNTYLNLCIAARGSGEAAAVATTCGRGHEWPDQIWRPEHVSTWNADRLQNTASSNCLAARGHGESRAVATTCGYGWPDQHWY
jgi:hypothetical protein